MNLRSHIYRSRIRISNGELGPSLAAFALLAMAGAGVALRSSSVERRILFLPALLACPRHGSSPFVTAGHRLPGDLIFTLLSGLKSDSQPPLFSPITSSPSGKNHAPNRALRARAPSHQCLTGLYFRRPVVQDATSPRESHPAPVSFPFSRAPAAVGVLLTNGHRDRFPEFF